MPGNPLIEMGYARRARDAVLAARGGGDARAGRPGDSAAYEVLTRAELALNCDLQRLLDGFW